MYFLPFRILIAEAFEEIKDVMDYYGGINDKVTDFPFNFQLYKVKATDSGTELFNKVDIWLKNMPKGKYPNWVVCKILFSEFSLKFFECTFCYMTILYYQIKGIMLL